jgi:hypothetical protein
MKTLLLATFLAIPMVAQTWQCEQNLIFSNNGQPTDGIATIALASGVATGPNFNNTQQKCSGWVMSYSAKGFSAISIQLQSAAEGPTTFAAFQGTIVTGTNPSTVITSATLVALGYYPYLNISVGSSTGTGFINVSLRGYVNMNQVVGTQIINRGLIGHWTLNEGSGSVAYDSSGNGNIGTWHGTQAGTSGYYSAGMVGQWAGNFNGSNNYITFTLPTTLPALTISAWIYKTGAGSNDPRAIFIRLSATTYFDICDASHLFFDVLGTQILGTGACASTGVWEFYTGTYNGATLSLYINGASVATPVALTGSVTTLTPMIGGLTSTTFFLNGLINDVRIYNRALTAAEVQILYNVTSTINSL